MHVPHSVDGCYIEVRQCWYLSLRLPGCHPPNLDAIPPIWMPSPQSGCHPPNLDAIPPIWMPSPQSGCHPPNLDAILPIWMPSSQSGCHPPNLDVIPPTRMPFLPLCESLCPCLSVDCKNSSVRKDFRF